uniref:Ribosomal RNA small subunit methyltransferase A n=1 Tax=Candidatus Kentrum sp. FM TaxID=2126340 RepID=A0A450WWE4_9GAMM|nr:MAG: 16S rRNA (adenine1518-N6/adenine1519-N6)-dimethyltransferase [Candidatus Kentron sp. FM]
MPFVTDTTGRDPRGFRARKRFGQHFLQDRHVTDRIVSSIAIEPGEVIVEIGPGLGALTAPLFARTEHLHVVELDRDLAARLAERFSAQLQNGTFSLHTADALTFDFAALTSIDRPLRIVGNLPYNISTPLLFHLLSQSRYIRDMHIMLQREVANRISAPPCSADYGRLSVMVQWHCLVERLFEVGSGAFSPPPRVTSAVVRLTIRKVPPAHVPDREVLGRLVAQAFSHRRKTLRNCLRGWLTEDEILAAGVDPGARPETLDLRQFAGLANRVAQSGEISTEFKKDKVIVDPLKAKV